MSRKGSSGFTGGGAAPGSYSPDANSDVRMMSGYVGDAGLEKQAESYLNSQLNENETYATVDDFTILQNPTVSGLADVEVEYSVNVQIPYTDFETGETMYDYDTEYHKTTLQLKVINK